MTPFNVHSCRRRRVSAPALWTAALLSAAVAVGLPAHAQTLYVANLSDNTIEQFNSSGVGTQFNVSGDLNGPVGLAFDSAGNLYVGNQVDNTIEEFNSLGVGTQFNVSGDLNYPIGLAFAPSASSVPEPGSTALLAGLGLTGLSLIARRRRLREAVQR